MVAESRMIAGTKAKSTTLTRRKRVRTSLPPLQTKATKKKLSASDRETQRIAEVVYGLVSERFVNHAFTRDDVLSLISGLRITDEASSSFAAGTAGLNDIATSTRIGKLSHALRHLLHTNKLTVIDNMGVKLCLPSIKKQIADQADLREAYLPTIRNIIKTITPGTKIDAITVVDRWTSDAHVAYSVKRMTVRQVLPRLVNDHLLKKGEIKNTFVIEG